jgi:hypothetical protein
MITSICISFEIFMLVILHTVVFWVVTLSMWIATFQEEHVASICFPENGNRIFLSNTGIHL